MPQTSEHIFISYARDDVNFAKKLAEALTRRGFSVWWDFSLVPGKHFRDEIASKIDTAKIVVVVWSPNSVSSGFVLDEASRALRHDKLVPFSISGALPPLGFGHLHTLPIDSIDRDIDRILAAVEQMPAQRVSTRKRKAISIPVRILFAGAVLLTISGGVVALIDRRHIDTASNCLRFGCELNYVTYRSKNMGLEFVYPMRQLTLDTTKEHLQRLPMLNLRGETEVEISRSPLPPHRDPVQGSADEQNSLVSSGCTINYVAPQVRPAQKNWYVIAGMMLDGRRYYIRRWYTVGDVVSIEFHYRPEFKSLYDKIIVDMTLGGIQILDPI